MKGRTRKVESRNFAADSQISVSISLDVLGPQGHFYCIDYLTKLAYLS
jgi:hypothetical protein